MEDMNLEEKTDFFLGYVDSTHKKAFIMQLYCSILISIKIIKSLTLILGEA